ncbi:MAG: sugar phosphate isomerase/epimerase family protein [Acetivibrionales bacterium]|jgi:sugar phosphate isomerase/epimerase
MKIAFSTLGCPGWSWNEMTATAKDFGFDGIEIRGIGNELCIPKAKPFLEGNLEKTMSGLSRMNLEIPCLTSSCFLFEKPSSADYINEAKQYIDLAEKIGCRYIRVLGDSGPEPRDEVDDNFVAQNLLVLGRYAEGKKVIVLIETNGAFSDSKRLLRLMEKVDNPNTGVLWDIHHPFRFMNEPVKETYNNLKKYIQYVHIKDSVIEEGKVKYKMMGSGDIPVEESLLLLKSNGYKGYVSLEWVKRWCLELEEPGIVFSHFANYVRKIIC